MMIRLSKNLKRTFRRQQLAGSTLVETVVAMTILLFILSLAMLQVNRLNASVNPGLLYQAHLASNEAMDPGCATGETAEVNGFTVSKEITGLENGLREIHIVISDPLGKTCYTRKLYRHEAY